MSFVKLKQAGYAPDGRRMYFKGGSSSGQREATGEERRLWAAQATSLESLNAVAMPNLVTGMNNLGTLANESMDGTLATRLRGMAGADASAAIGQGLTGATQKLERYGSTLNPNAMAAQMASTGLAGAAVKSNAMNQANVAAEDTKWNRNAALTGLASGQGAQAISGMGSLSGQISANRQAANNADAQAQANNTAGLVGLGSIGAYMMAKDGGHVARRGIRFANGGLNNFQSVSMPKVAPFNFNSSGKAPSTDGGALETAVGLAVPAMGINTMANGLNKIGISAPKQAIDGAIGAGREGLRQLTGIGLQDAAPVADAVVKPVGDVVASAATDAAANATTSAIADTAASTAISEGLAGAGSSLLGAVGTAMPYIAAGYALGSVLDLWADGGPVPKRKDMTKGGDVRGAGSGTSDSIPAWLSNGEHVQNAESVKMPRSQTAKVVNQWLDSKKDTASLLDAINDAGLVKRYGSKEAVNAMKAAEGQSNHKALGGLAALGHVARGFVPTAMTLDQQKIQNDRLAAQDARTAELYGLQIAQARQAASDEDKARALLQSGIEGAEAIRQGQGDEQLSSMLARINGSKDNPYGGQIAFTGSLPGGGRAGRIVSADGKSTDFSLSGDELADQYMRNHMEQLRTISPAYWQKYQDAQAAAAKQQAEFAQKDKLNLRDNQTRLAVAEGSNATSRANNQASNAVGWANHNLAKSEKVQARKDASDAATAGLGLFREQNPNATPAQIEAVRTGVLPAVKKDGGYKTEFNEVASALGTPAVDEKGVPITDVMTGRQVINRNTDAEAAFFKWAQSRGYKDTNKAIPIYLAEKASAGWSAREIQAGRTSAGAIGAGGGR